MKEVLDLIEKLDTNAAEDQQIALTLVRKLESFHDEMVDEQGIPVCGLAAPPGCGHARCNPSPSAG